jgi:multicomponent Na+:H+ antiporter subunit B
MEDYLLSFTVFSTFLTVIAFIRSTNVFSIILLNAIFSLFSVIMYLSLDAPDVAMTEASVSGIASILSIYAIKSIYKDSFIFNNSFNPWLFSLALIFAALLIYASLDLPSFGFPKFNDYYLKNTAKEIDIPSVVASVLASYRGYDTLLETLVILVGGFAVLLLSEHNIADMAREGMLTQKITRFILPLILLFGLYIQFHGEVSPGGGFQAGAILSMAFILYGMTFGENLIVQIFSLNKLKSIAIIGVSIYFTTGLISLLNNASFLNYNALWNDSILGQKIGIVIVELGVGLSIFSTMLIIYLGFVNASDKPKL